MEISEAYIRGMFDGEGSIGIYTRGAKSHHQTLQPKVVISNTCLPILVAIKDFLENAGYKPLLRRKTNPPKGLPVYDLYLRCWNDILRFINEIGTNHPPKQATMDKVKAYSQVARKRRPRRLSAKNLEQLLGKY